MAERSKMDAGELAALVRGHIDDAEHFDTDDLSQRRSLAIEYYMGEMKDTPAEEGRSKVVDRTISDTIGWILPSLMRVFASGDRVAEYDPQTPQDEQAAKQATDYVNYIFLRECEGYRLLRDAIEESLKLGNGIIKHWWDPSVTYEVTDHRGLTEGQFLFLLQQEGVTPLQHTARPTGEIDPMTGAPVVLHDVKLRRAVRSGRLRIECIPPEEFLIERHAKSIEDATFVAHRVLRTRASLIAEGYARDQVMALGKSSDTEDEDEYLSRWNDLNSRRRGEQMDPMMEEVQIYECYLRTDFDGDDYPEWRRVVMAGTGKSDILANEEWGDEDVPFSDLCPIPQPHRWDGLSMYDVLRDVQRVKTVLMRQTLDNLYAVNKPQREVVAGQVENLDELYNPTFNGVVTVKSPGAVRDMAVPFVAASSFQMLSYMDDLAEKRSGVSRMSMSLDPAALQNQTAAAVSAAQTAAYAKTELYARNIADGLRRMFRIILRLIIANQDKARMIRLRDDWVEMDPTVWDAKMDVSVSVGLGSGSRDRDMALLGQILQQQKEIISLAGPENPIAGVDKVVRTLRQMVEVSGIKNSDSYFSEVTRDQVAAYMAERKQGGEEEDPKAKREAEMRQMEMAMKAQERQAEFQARQAEKAADLQFKREAAEVDRQLERDKATASIQMERERAAAMLQIEREKAALLAELKREEMRIEAELTAQKNMIAARQSAPAVVDTNIQGPF